MIIVNTIINIEAIDHTLFDSYDYTTGKCGYCNLQEPVYVYLISEDYVILYSCRLAVQKMTKHVAEVEFNCDNAPSYYGYVN